MIKVFFRSEECQSRVDSVLKSLFNLFFICLGQCIKLQLQKCVFGSVWTPKCNLIHLYTSQQGIEPNKSPQPFTWTRLQGICWGLLVYTSFVLIFLPPYRFGSFTEKTGSHLFGVHLHRTVQRSHKSRESQGTGWKEKTASPSVCSCSSLIRPETLWKMQNMPPLFSEYSVFLKTMQKFTVFGGVWCGNILELSPLALVYIRFWSLCRDPCFFSSSIYRACFLGTDHPYSTAKQASSLAPFNAERLQQHEEDATVTSGTRTSGISL